MKYIAVLALFILAVVYFWPSKKTETRIEDSIVKELSKDNNLPVYVEPRWKKWTRLREVSDIDLGVVLGDLESHIAKGHRYANDNKITYAHQVTHGINAAIRNQNYTKDGCNGFYVLQDRCIIFREPSLNVKDIAVEIPEKLRGPSYKLYLVDQQEKWNDRPLYIIDEWVAFTNGSEVGKELNVDGWYFELLQAHNFNIYAIYLAMIINRDTSNYQDAELRKFIMWNTERVFRITIPSDRNEILKDSQKKTVSFDNNQFCPHCRVEGVGQKVDMKRIKDYIDSVKTLPEAENLRNFSRNYFGEDWCKRVYGF